MNQGRQIRQQTALQPPAKQGWSLRSVAGSAANMLARPFAIAAATGESALSAGYHFAKGTAQATMKGELGQELRTGKVSDMSEFNKAQQALQPKKYEGFGEISPAKIGTDIAEQQKGAGMFGKETERTIGTGMQIGAFAAPAGVAGAAVGGALMGAGSAMEQEKSAGDVALSGAIGGVTGAVTGKATEFLGNLVGKGKQAAYDALKPVAKKLTAFTGLSKKEATLAFDEFPEITAEKLNIVKNAADPADAEAQLQSDLLGKVRSTYQRAKEKVGSDFQSAIEEVQSKYADATADIPGVAKKVMDNLPKFGKPATADETSALTGVLEILREPREYTVQGTRTLLSDLHSFADRLEEGTPAKRAAMSAWNDTRQELSKMTNGEIDPAMKAYSDFLEQSDALKPVWSQATKENQARTFVQNLTSTAKTASRDAVKYMEGIAPDVEGKSVVPELTIHKLVKKLAVDQKVTGSRLGELLLAGGIYTAGGSVGELIGGEKGKQVAEVTAGLVAGHALAPSQISKVLLSGLEESGVKTTGVFRQKMATLISDPKTAQVLLRLLQGMTQGTDKGNNDQATESSITREELKRKLEEEALAKQGQ